MLKPRVLVRPSHELMKRGTCLEESVIRLSNEIGPDRAFDTDLRLQVVQSQLKQLCPDYSPSRLRVLGVPAGGAMCRSGENSGGRSYRTECKACLAGQFSPSTGEFLGIEEA